MTIEKPGHLGDLRARPRAIAQVLRLGDEQAAIMTLHDELEASGIGDHRHIGANITAERLPAGLRQLIEFGGAEQIVGAAIVIQHA